MGRINGRVKGNVYPRTGHEDPGGDRGTSILFL